MIQIYNVSPSSKDIETVSADIPQVSLGYLTSQRCLIIL